MTANLVLHDLINNMRMKSSGEHLAGRAVITFKTSANVTGIKGVKLVRCQGEGSRPVTAQDRNSCHISSDCHI